MKEKGKLEGGVGRHNYYILPRGHTYRLHATDHTQRNGRVGLCSNQHACSYQMSVFCRPCLMMSP